MSRISILLDEKTIACLVELAKQEYRDPRQQAALIIRLELERRGLIKNTPASVGISVIKTEIESEVSHAAG